MDESKNESKNEYDDWSDEEETLRDIHETEIIKDRAKHAAFLKNEKEENDNTNANNNYFTLHAELANKEYPYPYPYHVAQLLQSPRAQAPSINEKPGIGLLGIGEENDYDVFDTDFHGGKTRRKNKSRSRKNKSRSRKNKRSRKFQKSKRTKNSSKSRC